VTDLPPPTADRNGSCCGYIVPYNREIPTFPCHVPALWPLWQDPESRQARHQCPGASIPELTPCQS